MSSIMKKMLKPATVINSLVCASVAFPSALVFSSCNKPTGGIKSIALTTKLSYVYHGDSIKINKVVKPSSYQNAPLLWTVEDGVEGIEVSDDGVLSVSTHVKLEHPIAVMVMASDPLNPDMYAAITINVVPNTSSNVLGFLDGQVLGLDENYNTTFVPIIKKDIYTYEMEREIDMFSDTSLYASSLLFYPIFKYRQSHNVKLEIEGGEKDSGISWIGYSDGSWIDFADFPVFTIINAADHKIKINVSFQADERVHLVLKLNLWFRDNPNGFFVSYGKEGALDTHKVVPDSLTGSYSVYLQRQRKTTEGCSDSIGSLYLFRPPLQYPTMTFSLSGTTKEFEYLKDKVTWTQEMVERPYDNLPYYIINFDDFFFPEKIFPDTDNLVSLFQLQAFNNSGGYIGGINFYLLPPS